MHGLLNYSSCLLLIVFFFDGVQASRYRTCDEGCCIHEYCAFHRICYPKIHCRFGCPDGHCVGKDKPTSPDDITAYIGVKRTRDAAGMKLSETSKENYSPLKEDVNTKRDGDRSGLRVSGKAYDDAAMQDEALTPPKTDVVSGICMPDPPCKSADHCGMAHSCSMNFNLGYRTCQYNLDIGSTLCFDNKGNLNMKPMT